MNILAKFPNTLSCVYLFLFLYASKRRLVVYDSFSGSLGQEDQTWPRSETRPYLDITLGCLIQNFLFHCWDWEQDYHKMAPLTSFYALPIKPIWLRRGIKREIIQIWSERLKHTAMALQLSKSKARYSNMLLPSPRLKFPNQGLLESYYSARAR